MPTRKAKDAGRRQSIVAVGLSVVFAVFTPSGSSAETITGALESAYRTNPMLGGARAGVRATDESVSQAHGGFRPQVNAEALLGAGDQRGIDIDGPVRGLARPRGAGLIVTQRLFDGGRTINGVRRAEAQVFASREVLRGVEQQVLADAARAYMDVLRDTAIVDLEANNIALLREQLRHTRDLNKNGYVTPTDVAQAATALTRARADYAVATAVLQTTLAGYRRVIGATPSRLEAARPVDSLLPPSLEEAVRVATTNAPSVAAASQEVDVAQLEVKLEEGRLYPTVDALANSQAAGDSQGFFADRVSRGDHIVSAGATVRADVPIYSGGATEAAVRQAKERLGQAALRVQSERRAVRSRLEDVWAQLRAAHGLVTSTRAAIGAAQSALSNVRLEADAGKRTTLDVLRAQASLLAARVALVRAQRDTVVRGYEVLAEVGWLSPARLGLRVVSEDPAVHFNQVRDRWSGLRTPDGR